MTAASVTWLYELTRRRLQGVSNLVRKGCYRAILGLWEAPGDEIRVKPKAQYALTIGSMPAGLPLAQRIVEVLHGLKQLHLPSCLSNSLEVLQQFLEAHLFNLWFSGSESPHLEVRPARLRVDELDQLPQHYFVVHGILPSPGLLSPEFVKVCLQESQAGEVCGRTGNKKPASPSIRCQWACKIDPLRASKNYPPVHF